MPYNPTFPTPPQRSGGGSMSFPADLTSGQKDMYTNIGFVEYNSASGGMSLGGQYKLPIPKNLLEVESITWAENSIGGTAMNIMQDFGVGGQGGLMGAIRDGGDLASAATGYQLNPFYFMVYKRPNFKDHVFNWSLAPSTKKESDTLKEIITAFKKAALPSSGGGMGVLMKYPKIAMVSFSKDKYLYKLKPCAILSVQVEYAPAGPAFFKDTNAPVVVNLGIMLKEIKLWKSEDL